MLQNSLHCQRQMISQENISIRKPNINLINVQNQQKNGQFTEKEIQTTNRFMKKYSTLNKKYRSEMTR